MILQKARYEILSKIDNTQILQNIERAGRVCYKSEGKITDKSSIKFVEMLLKRGHTAVLEHEILSVRFIFDRGISHEIVRHRHTAFCQESTRFCNYSKNKFKNQITCIDVIQHLKNKESFDIWLDALEYAEKAYFKLLELGETPQIARGVLPTALKTEIVVTANLREWIEIFKQRTAKVAHPQIREVMQPLLLNLKNKLPIIFKDIE